MSRKVCNLLWAKLGERPKGLPKSRPRGSKADGLRYEKLVAKALPVAEHGLWYEYQDANGLGWCQPDFVILQPWRTIVIEVKLSNYEAACEQIEYLYKPILLAAHKLPVHGLVIQKRLRSATPREAVVATLDRALSRRDCVPLLHWLGHDLSALVLNPPSRATTERLIAKMA